VNPFLEEGVAPSHRFVVAPVVCLFQPLRNGGELAEHHLTDDVVREQLPQSRRQRLVMVVLANQHDPGGTVSRVDHGLVILDLRERGLLDQDVLAGGECLQRKVTMETGRDGDDHRSHTRIVDRRVIVRVAAGPLELAAI
jgi:hypothetical protein